MKKLLLVFVMLSGCSSYDKVQALRDCEFEGIKLDKAKQEDYTFTCMHKKGYDFTFEPSCTTYNANESCWNYSWRVFL